MRNDPASISARSGQSTQSRKYRPSAAVSASAVALHARPAIGSASAFCAAASAGAGLMIGTAAAGAAASASAGAGAFSATAGAAFADSSAYGRISIGAAAAAPSRRSPAFPSRAGSRSARAGVCACGVSAGRTGATRATTGSSFFAAARLPSETPIISAATPAPASAAAANPAPTAMRGNLGRGRIVSMRSSAKSGAGSAAVSAAAGGGAGEGAGARRVSRVKGASPRSFAAAGRKMTPRRVASSSSSSTNFQRGSSGLPFQPARSIGHRCSKLGGGGVLPRATGTSTRRASAERAAERIGFETAEDCDHTTSAAAAGSSSVEAS